MKKAMYFCAIMGALLLMGCTGGKDVPAASYGGMTELELVRTFGTPERSYAVGETKFLTYASRRTQILKGVAGGQRLGAPMLMTGAPSRTVHRYCVTTFEVAAGTVTDWKMQGNDCPVN